MHNLGLIFIVLAIICIIYGSIALTKLSAEFWVLAMPQ